MFKNIVLPVALLGAFFLLQAGKLHGNGFAYQLLNALGAGAVLVSLLYAIIQAPEKGWLAPEVAVAFGFAMVLLGAFAFWELHTAEPMIDLRVFRNPRVRNPSEFANESFRRVEMPSTNGIGEVRALARVYGELASGGTALGLDRATLDEIESAPVAGRDAVLGIEMRHWLGFSKPCASLRYGSDRAFGTSGLGGSFGFGDPATGAPVGTYAIRLFDQLGISPAIKSKLKFANNAASERQQVANGDAEIGLSQTSVIIATPGIELAGSLPAEIQNYTVFTAAAPTNAREPVAAKDLVKFLQSPVTMRILKSKGLAPD